MPRIIEFLGYVPEDDASEAGFRQEVSNARVILGLSRRKMAQLVGADEATVMKWERGHSLPLERNSEAIKRLFNREICNGSMVGIQPRKDEADRI